MSLQAETETEYEGYDRISSCISVEAFEAILRLITNYVEEKNWSALHLIVRWFKELVGVMAYLRRDMWRLS